MLHDEADEHEMDDAHEDDDEDEHDDDGGVSWFIDIS